MLPLIPTRGRTYYARNVLAEDQKARHPATPDTWYPDEILFISHWLPVLIDSAVIVSSIFNPFRACCGLWVFHTIRICLAWRERERERERERDDQVYTTVIKQLQTFEVYMHISFYVYILQCLWSGLCRLWLQFFLSSGKEIDFELYSRK